MVFLRAAAFLCVLTAVFVFVVPIQWLARRRDWALQHAIQLAFCRAVCAILGVRVMAHGRLPGAAPRLIVANHVSWTDIIALASLHPMVFLAKSEVSAWPVLGFLARLQGTVFVERANRRKIPQVNLRLAEKLREGRDIVIFPEGTSSDGAAVLRFNTAHFGPLCDPAVAWDVGPKLAPVAILYAEPGADPFRKPVDVGWYGDMTFLPHLWRLMRRGGVACHIFFGEAIDAPGGRKALANAAQESVRDLLRAPRRERTRVDA